MSKDFTKLCKGKIKNCRTQELPCQQNGKNQDRRFTAINTLGIGMCLWVVSLLTFIFTAFNSKACRSLQFGSTSPGHPGSSVRLFGMEGCGSEEAAIYFWESRAGAVLLPLLGNGFFLSEFLQQPHSTLQWSWTPQLLVEQGSILVRILAWNVLCFQNSKQIKWTKLPQLPPDSKK